MDGLTPQPPVVEEVAQQPHSLPRNRGQGGELGLDRLDRRGVTAPRNPPVVEEVAQQPSRNHPQGSPATPTAPLCGGVLGGTVSRVAETGRG